MSNFSFDDFAVLVRNLDMSLIADGQPLHIVPLKAAVSMANAMRGIVDFGSSEAYIPLNKDGSKVESNVTIQHDSDGYCRLVGHLVFNKTQKEGESPAEPFDAQAFALYHGTDEAPTVLAVASLKSGFVIGDECYCDFTITTTNNYQSVSFNPNAFATLEDLKAINGLDGLHIAYDKASGDIKLLDKEGHVIDQANIPVKSDVIIADGEEGYKYVKTDVQQDIHAAKAWMPEGSTAWDDVDEQLYEMQNAALVVANNEDGIEEVLGIATITGSSEDPRMTMYRMDDENRLVPVSGGKGAAWLSESEYDAETMELKYSLDAFVWTVKDSMDDTESFFGRLNASLIDLGFHVGDDIALGTNLQHLAVLEDGIDAEEYMHGDDADERANEVKAQRELAKAELVAWNAQHPALRKDISSGTRISSDGVDVRDGKLLIGDGAGLDSDSVKHYELSTNFSDGRSLEDTGLTLSVMDASNGGPRNVLTISDSSYISGAPICMAMVEITAAVIDGDTSISCIPKRRTANFECDMSEVDGTVSIELKDNRDNTKGFMEDCIVEITPVYISNGSAPEMLPALNQVNTVGTAVESEDGGNSTTLTCTCPQIIDWASSVNLGEGSEDGNGARLFAIVKVY